MEPQNIISIMPLSKEWDRFPGRPAHLRSQFNRPEPPKPVINVKPIVQQAVRQVSVPYNVASFNVLVRWLNKVDELNKQAGAAFDRLNPAVCGLILATTFIFGSYSWSAIVINPKVEQVNATSQK